MLNRTRQAFAHERTLCGITLTPAREDVSGEAIFRRLNRNAEHEQVLDCIHNTSKCCRGNADVTNVKAVSKARIRHQTALEQDSTYN